MADEKKSPAEIKAEQERKAYNQKNAKFLAGVARSWALPHQTHTAG